MKRAVIVEPYRVEIEDADVPAPKAGEMLLKTLVTGIAAGTEMNLYRGTNPDLVRRRWGANWTYPMYPGQEHVGVVVDHGPGASGPPAGTRVLGYAKHAEYSVVQANSVVQLPDGLDDETATLGMFGTTGLHGVRRARVEYGDSVAVVGMGVIGQFAAQHARLSGAAITIAVDPDPWRLDVARRLGATHTINPDEEDAAAVVTELTGIGADAVVETAGVPSAVPLALKLARSRGRVSIVGWHLKPVELVLAEDFMFKELDVFASRGSGMNEVAPEEILRWTATGNRQTVVDYIAEGRLRTDGLVTHVLPFEDISKAYEIVDKRTEPSLQIVLRGADISETR